MGQNGTRPDGIATFLAHSVAAAFEQVTAIGEGIIAVEIEIPLLAIQPVVVAVVFEQNLELLVHHVNPTDRKVLNS